jgi:acyl-CoA thioester hydrolase
VRYGDLDSQRHVNNARHFTYMEEARSAYLRKVGLWDGKDFDRIGIILAEQTCRYLIPITYLRTVDVGVRTVRLGNKSIDMQYSMRDSESGEELATGKTVLVTYDYLTRSSIPIPREWRETLAQFDGLS